MGPSPLVIGVRGLDTSEFVEIMTIYHFVTRQNIVHPVQDLGRFRTRLDDQLIQVMTSLCALRQHLSTGWSTRRIRTHTLIVHSTHVGIGRGTGASSRSTSVTENKSFDTTLKRFDQRGLNSGNHDFGNHVLSSHTSTATDEGLLELTTETPLPLLSCGSRNALDLPR